MPRVVYEDARIPIDRYILEGVDTSAGPIMRVGTVAQVFFHRSNQWVRVHDGRLDGEKGEDRRFTLADVEQFAHSLAKSGTIDGNELRKVLRIVRAIALAWGYIE